MIIIWLTFFFVLFSQLSPHAPGFSSRLAAARAPSDWKCAREAHASYYFFIFFSRPERSAFFTAYCILQHWCQKIVRISLRLIMNPYYIPLLLSTAVSGVERSRSPLWLKRRTRVLRSVHGGVHTTSSSRLVCSRIAHCVEQKGIKIFTYLIYNIH